MPPAISDDEASDVGDMPAPVSAVRRGKKSSPVDYRDNIKDEDDDVKNEDDEMLDAVKGDIGNGDDADEADENEDDDDMEEDEYVVEMITAHTLIDGKIKFQVKWEGYDKKSDRTWEDEENLRENASSVLDEYLEKVGGRDAIIEQSTTGRKTKKRGHPASTPTAGSTSKRSRQNGSHPASTTPPTGVEKAKWKPPAGSWEDEVDSIDACHDEQSGKLIVYLTWKDGNKTQHDTKVIYKRCPQKMLHFYEQHVKIVKKSENMGL